MEIIRYKVEGFSVSMQHGNMYMRASARISEHQGRANIIEGAGEPVGTPRRSLVEKLLVRGFSQQISPGLGGRR